MREPLRIAPGRPQEEKNKRPLTLLARPGDKRRE